jgi:hypothetical protein
LAVVLGEVLLGEVGERDAGASLAGLRRGQRLLQGCSRVVGAEVPAALDPSRAASVEAVAIGPQALPAGSRGLEFEDLPVLHGRLRLSPARVLICEGRAPVARQRESLRGPVAPAGTI